MSIVVVRLENVMRVRGRPGGLASFGLRVSSDYDDAISLARGVRRYCCRLLFFYETPSHV